MNKVHKEVGVQPQIKVVVTRMYSKFGEADIQSAINAIDYAAKKHLRIDHSVQVTGSGTVLGNVLILDVEIPLEYSNSTDWKRRESDFNKEVVNYLVGGVLHRTSGKTFGGFGNLTSVGYFSPSAVRTVTIETDLSDDELVGKGIKIA